MKDSRIPIVRNSWNIVPSMPRVEISAISEMYVGTRTQDAPTPMPTMNLAILISHNFDAVMMIAQERRNGIVSRRSDFFRPSLSAIGPDGTALNIAPRASNELTQDPCSSLMTSQEVATYSWGRTGDVQARAVPAATAIMEAEGKMNY